MFAWRFNLLSHGHGIDSSRKLEILVPILRILSLNIFINLTMHNFSLGTTPLQNVTEILIPIGA